MNGALEVSVTPSIVLVGLFVGLAALAAGWVLAWYVAGRGPGVGWVALMEHFGTEEPPIGSPIFHGETVRVDRVTARRCALVGVSGRGLFVKCPWRKAILIPWRAFTDVRPTLLNWGHATRLAVGHPAIATITVRAEVADALHPFLLPEAEVARPQNPTRPRTATPK